MTFGTIYWEFIPNPVKARIEMSEYEYSKLLDGKKLKSVYVHQGVSSL